MRVLCPQAAGSVQNNQLVILYLAPTPQKNAACQSFPLVYQGQPGKSDLNAPTYWYCLLGKMYTAVSSNTTAHTYDHRYIIKSVLK